MFTDEAFIGYMLRFESTLAQAQATQQIIPAEAAQVIHRCCRVENIKMHQLIADAGLGGNVNIPLVRQLTQIVKTTNAEAAKYVHFGATSQDVLDTAMMMQVRDALLIIDRNLVQLIGKLAALAETHRPTVMMGRSLMQQARPITFGFKAAQWLDSLLRSQRRVQKLLAENCVLQLGGAVGTLHGMMGKGLQVAAEMSLMLELKLPTVPWHTQRDSLAEAATTLGIACGSLGKIARDISLLMQTEIAEVFEPSGEGRGGSSTMPHKRNPVSCVTILANAQRVPALVATMLSSMVQDQERATGTWHAEWETMSDIVRLTAGALGKAVDLMEGLKVDKGQMLHNVELTKGLIFAENVSLALADKIGRQDAHALMESYCREVQTKGLHLKEVLLTKEEITRHFTYAQLERLFDPAYSLGMCDEFIDRVIAEKQQTFSR